MDSPAGLDIFASEASTTCGPAGRGAGGNKEKPHGPGGHGDKQKGSPLPRARDTAFYQGLG